jgi:hypothetical protein
MNSNGNAADASSSGGRRRIRDWTYDKDFSWWQDGTSNQLCLAEKHVPMWAYTEDDELWWDGTFVVAYTNVAAANVARIVSDNINLFAPSPNNPNRVKNVSDRPTGDSTNRGGIARQGMDQLGSCHPGVVNFLVGDGSVRGISTTALPLTITQLTVVNDGNSAAIP